MLFFRKQCWGDNWTVSQLQSLNEIKMGEGQQGVVVDF